MSALLFGVAAGIVTSATMVFIAVMCIHRTLNRSRLSGFFTGLGAAAAHTVFAIPVWFFTDITSSFIANNEPLLKIAGGVFVSAFGVVYLLKKPAAQTAPKGGLTQDFTSTFVLTLTNPVFILWLLLVFSMVGINSGDVWAEIQTILGFFAGAAAWWFALSWAISLLRNRFRPHHLLRFNRAAGGLLVAMGAAAIVSAFIA